MAIKKSTIVANVGEDMEKGILYTVGGNSHCSLWQTTWRCLRKLKIELPYDPEISLRIYIQKRALNDMVKSLN